MSSGLNPHRSGPLFEDTGGDLDDDLFAPADDSGDQLEDDEDAFNSILYQPAPQPSPPPSKKRRIDPNLSDTVPSGSRQHSVAPEEEDDVIMLSHLTPTLAEGTPTPIISQEAFQAVSTPAASGLTLDLTSTPIGDEDDDDVPLFGSGDDANDTTEDEEERPPLPPRAPNVPCSRLSKCKIEEELFPEQVDLSHYEDYNIDKDGDMVCSACLIQLIDPSERDDPVEPDEPDDVPLAKSLPSSVPTSISPSDRPTVRGGTARRAVRSPATPPKNPLDVLPRESIGMISCCYHLYHAGCISRWTRTDNSCCMCKQRYGALVFFDRGGRRLRWVPVKKTLQCISRRELEQAELQAQEASGEVCNVCHMLGDRDSVMTCSRPECDTRAHFYCLNMSERMATWVCQDCSAPRPTVLPDRPVGRRRVAARGRDAQDGRHREGSRGRTGQARPPSRRSRAQRLTPEETRQRRDHIITTILNETPYEDLQDRVVPAARLLPSEVQQSQVTKSRVDDLILGTVPEEQLTGRPVARSRTRAPPPAGPATVSKRPGLSSTVAPLASRPSRSQPAAPAASSSRSRVPGHRVRTPIGACSALDKALLELNVQSSRVSMKSNHTQEVYKKAAEVNDALDELLPIDDLIGRIKERPKRSAPDSADPMAQIGYVAEVTGMANASPGGLLDPTTPTAPRAVQKRAVSSNHREPPKRPEINTTSKRGASLTISKAAMATAQASASRTISEVSSAPTMRPSSKPIVAISGLRVGRPVATRGDATASPELVDVVMRLIDRLFPAVSGHLREMFPGEPARMYKAKMLLVKTLIKEKVPAVYYAESIRQPENERRAWWESKLNIISDLICESPLLTAPTRRQEWIEKNFFSRPS